MIICNGSVLKDKRLLGICDVRISNGSIIEFQKSLTPDIGEQVIDASGNYVLPGLIDLHTHGLHNIYVQENEFCEYSKLQATMGVTSCLPTLFGSPQVIIDSIKKGLKQTDSFRKTPNLLGFRLEMPYLAKPGAGHTGLLAAITPSSIQEIYQSARGFIKIWDVSPELDGAIEFIGWAKRKGIVTSLAHTRASIEQTQRAVEAGLSLVTHFYDTFDLPIETDPGVYPVGLTDYIQIEDRLIVEIIPDSVHVHPFLVEMTFRCKGADRIAFITDSVKGAGNPPGIYSGLYPSVQVEVTKDRGVRRLSDDALSGSALTQIQSFQNAVSTFGKTIAEASTVCSRTPASVLGLREKGYLEVGMDADIIILDKNMQLKATLVKGNIVFQKE
jgi:N-acetylglucosamine-6-phosphate deacetylase